MNINGFTIVLIKFVTVFVCMYILYTVFIIFVTRQFRSINNGAINRLSIKYLVIYFIVIDLPAK